MAKFSSKFFVKLVQDHISVIKNSNDTKWIETFSDSYSYIKMTKSLLGILKVDDSVKNALQDHLDKKYPEILLLMNLNGSLCLRSKTMINFSKNKENAEVC